MSVEEKIPNSPSPSSRSPKNLGDNTPSVDFDPNSEESTMQKKDSIRSAKNTQQSLPITKSTQTKGAGGSKLPSILNMFNSSSQSPKKDPDPSSDVSLGGRGHRGERDDCGGLPDFGGIQTICSPEEKGSFSYTKLTSDQSPRRNFGKNKNYKSPTSSSFTSYFLLVVSLLKFFIQLSVLALLLGTLWWFHVRLTLLESTRAAMEKVVMKSSVQLGERNAPESQLPLSFLDTSGSGLVINEVGNGRTVSSSGQPSPPRDRVTPSAEKIRVKRRVDSGSGQRERSRSSNPNLSNYNVEFINPKGREDVERERSGGSQDQEGSEGPSNSVPDDDWVWLTSYSRIPLLAIQEFCSATKEYCPRGETGPPGLQGKEGIKGISGNPGLPGDSGTRGPQGPPGIGLRGPKGEPGLPGMGGADGRDGLNGEPGLDGIPGRSGLDGVPGIDGIPGFDGRPGNNGTNGRDGTPGPQGAQGPPGLRGLPGPQGRQGPAGQAGQPGSNGITAYSYNDTKGLQHLLIPPSIMGSPTKARPLIVNEKEHVRLRCTATGSPRPTITWTRQDGREIRSGSWKATSSEGSVLNITSINREHMGEYICTANNGVNPEQQRSFFVEVHFPPMIRIQNQKVAVSLGATLMLECYVEAFPITVTYWEKSDGRVLHNGEKYQVDTKDKGLYKIRMTLNITKVTANDLLGRYHCVAKNELGTTRGDFWVKELDPTAATSPPKTGSGQGVAIYGQEPPEHADLDDLCKDIKVQAEACPTCPKIETGKCQTGGFALLDMLGWEISALGSYTIPPSSNRTQACELSAVGKPVFNRDLSKTHNPVTTGCWMKDPLAKGEIEKHWLIMTGSTILHEFPSKAAFTSGHPSKNLSLPFPVRGNFHAVYNGSFFYVTDSKEASSKLRIVRYDLMEKRKPKEEIPYLELTFASNEARHLYSSGDSKVDLSIDENGLWAIHSLPNSNNTAVLKIHVSLEGNMEVLFGWNITISHTHAGDMFIICGVLYAVDSTTARDTKIRLALDLYRRSLNSVDLGFSNPFKNTSMVSYNPNPKARELLTWDKGNLLIYPIKCIEPPPYIEEENNKLPEDNFLWTNPDPYPPSSYNN